MKNTSKILFLIGGIVSCCEAIVYLSLGIFMCWFGTSEDIKTELLKNYSAADVMRDFGNGVTPVEAVEALQAVYVAFGVVFFIYIFIAIANAVVSFIARGKNSKPLFIINIILGFVSGCIVNSVGGILATIAANREVSSPSIE